MKFANATNLNRKSGGAKPRDLRFRGPLLETRNDKGGGWFFHEDSVMIGGGCGPVGAGHTNGAPQIARLRFGMTKRRGSFQGKGGC
jgi:hypothetical protein